MIVAPDWQGQGIGAKLLQVAEKTAPAEVTTYELFTGAASERNLPIYRKAGYREIRRETQTEKVDLVLLGQAAPAALHPALIDGLISSRSVRVANLVAVAIRCSCHRG